MVENLIRNEEKKNNKAHQNFQILISRSGQRSHLNFSEEMPGASDEEEVLIVLIIVPMFLVNIFVIFFVNIFVVIVTTFFVIIFAVFFVTMLVINITTFDIRYWPTL